MAEQKKEKFIVRVKSGCKKFAGRVKKWYNGVTHKDDPHYISGKEARKIARENRKTTLMYEKRKRKSVAEQEYLSEMKNPDNILEIEDLKTYFFTDAGVSKAVDGVSFEIPKNSVVGVVGESGCGKSVTSLSVMQLVQAPQGQIVGGAIRFNTQDYKRGDDGKPIPVWEYDEKDGERVIKTEQVTNKKGAPVFDKDGKPKMKQVQAVDGNGFPAFELEDKVFDITKMPTSAMRRIRGKEIAMIFQEPMTSLNPLFTIGNQLDEVVLLHTPGADKALAKKRTLEMLGLVGIAMPDIVYKSYPHELSGGMRQRVMIAMALACNPKLIVADEPTTALDVTIQAQVLDLLLNVKDKINGSIMLITHDLGVIAGMADYVVVMYAGRVIEKGTVEDIFDTPLHPYTIGLQKSKPVINKDVDWLYSIKGQVPNPIDMPKYCYFKDRCEHCTAVCDGEYPPLVNVTPTHSVACYLAAERLKRIEEERAAKEKAEKAQAAKEQAAVDNAAIGELADNAQAEAKPAKNKSAKKSTGEKKPAAKSKKATTENSESADKSEKPTKKPAAKKSTAGKNGAAQEKAKKPAKKPAVKEDSDD